MAKIAITGHSERGKEVIEILEMLGGKNTFGLSGDASDLYYFIDNNNKISYTYTSSTLYKITDFKIFTVEEFLEKFPYKIGDKVTLDKWPCIITGMSWEYDDIIYYVQGIDFSKGVYSKDKDLQPYKETMNPKIAIKGHKTRGKEVIEILEMLGGVNTYKYSGDNEEICFCIGCATKMIYYEWINDCYGDESIFVFALEEFLEKYPYKIGDKVTVTGLPEYPKIIKFMEWFDGDIHYSFDNETWFPPSGLNLYKEETMEVKRMAFAIVGHNTRGKEVIEILEMLGGTSKVKLNGHNIFTGYYIDSNGNIDYKHCSYLDDAVLYTLEEFLEKYPYKVGDRVRIPEYESEVCINKMLWNGNEVLYEVVVDDEVERYSAEELNEFNEPNKEETITIDDFKANTKEWLIDKLHGMVISKAIKTIGDIHEELHKPQYPKTYEECCKVLGIDSDNYLSIRNLYRDDGDEETTDYESDLLVKRYLLEKFDHLWELTICRDAYWKIVGEQMGLGKPWKPDWLDISTYKYCIYYVGDEIKKQPMSEVHHFLAFPTKEMSSVFFENFKELIESCEHFL